MDMAPAIIKLLRVIRRSEPSKAALVDWWIDQINALRAKAPTGEQADAPAAIEV